MKNISRLIVYMLLCQTVISCTPPGCGGPVEPMIYNQSGHTVSVVHDPDCDCLPDSLVMPDGERYYLERLNYSGKAFFQIEGYESRKIYYDGRYLIHFHELPEDRAIHIKEQSFQYIPRFETVVYTFTESDYDYAVEHGTDLGEPKPTAEQAEITTTRTDRND